MRSIVVFKTIAYLDDILPLMFELTKAQLVSSVVFVAYGRKAYDVAKKNYVLTEAINVIDGQLICMNKFSNKYLNQLVNVFFLKEFLFKPILAIDTFHISNHVYRALSNFNRILLKGKKIKALIDNKPLDLAESAMAYYREIRGDFTVNDKIINNYDAVLFFDSLQHYEKSRFVKLIFNKETRNISVGYTRGLREWRSFLKANINRLFPKTITGEYIFFPLSAVGNTHVKQENCISLSDKLKETLTVLKEFCGDIQTVFKPHHKTDVSVVKEIIDSVGFENYSFSYAHPLILISKAKFTLTYHSTSLLIEAYYNQCSTVEYAHYDPRFYKYTNGKSRYDDCVDHFIHRDLDKLRKVLKKLIYAKSLKNKIHPSRLNNDFPVLNNQEIREKFSWL